MTSQKNAEIEVKGTVYPGTRVFISSVVYLVRDTLKNVKFVKQDGKVGYLLNLSNTNGSIDEHEYTLPVDVEYMAKTTFRVKVKLYNGRILESSVTYNEPNGEVR